MAEETLRIRQFDEIPSHQEFASQIESQNIPAVIPRQRRNHSFYSIPSLSTAAIDCYVLLTGIQGLRKELESFVFLESLQWRSRLLAGNYT